MEEAWVFNTVADLDYVPEVIEETEDTIPNTVNYETYSHFVEKGLALGIY